MASFDRTTRILAAFLLLVTTGFLTACESEEPNTGTTVEDITDASDDDVLDDIFDAREVYENVNPYLGQTVTVSGEISEIYGTNAFTIGDDLWGEDLLVVAPSNATFSGTTAAGADVGLFGDLGTDYVVQVTGTVRQYMLAEVENDYGLDLVPDLEVEMEEQEPMIVAQSVRVMTEEAAEEMNEEMDEEL